MGSGTPLLDFFRNGSVPRELRLLAAGGGVTLRPGEQLGLLVWLLRDADPEIAAVASTTIQAIPTSRIAGMLAASDVTEDVRQHFAAMGITPAAAPVDDASLSASIDGDSVDSEPAGGQVDRRPIATLPIAERFKLAVFGSREQRSQLIRDPNKLVALAVLSSPRLTESEVENIARMTGVAEDVLRAISANRRWMRNYKVMSAIARNPKVPPAIAMHLINHLHARDVQMMSVDRNLPEVVRLTARKALQKQGAHKG